MASVIDRIKSHPAVEDVSDERGGDDGFWVYLKSGFCHPWEQGAHLIHEDSPTQCMSLLRNVAECKCADCVKERGESLCDGCYRNPCKCLPNDANCDPE